MEASGEYNFCATDDDELGFKTGDVLKILNYEDSNWFFAELDGKQGRIPVNYISFIQPKWFVGRMSRDVAVVTMSRQNYEIGAFLVRESDNSPGTFSISVKFDEGVIHHFKVFNDLFGKYSLWFLKFNSLNELVDYHKNNSISQTSPVMLKEVHFEPVRTRSVLMVKALFDFDPKEANELGFKRGDIITVLSQPEEGWWEGMLNNHTGFIPSMYVAPCSPPVSR